MVPVFPFLNRFHYSHLCSYRRVPGRKSASRLPHLPDLGLLQSFRSMMPDRRRVTNRILINNSNIKYNNEERAVHLLHNDPCQPYLTFRQNLGILLVRRFDQGPSRRRCSPAVVPLAACPGLKPTASEQSLATFTVASAGGLLEFTRWRWGCSSE